MAELSIWNHHHLHQQPQPCCSGDWLCELWTIRSLLECEESMGNFLGNEWLHSCCHWTESLHDWFLWFFCHHRSYFRRFHLLWSKRYQCVNNIGHHLCFDYQQDHFRHYRYLGDHWTGNHHHHYNHLGRRYLGSIHLRKDHNHHRHWLIHLLLL